MPNIAFVFVPQLVPDIVHKPPNLHKIHHSLQDLDFAVLKVLAN